MVLLRAKGGEPIKLVNGFHSVSPLKRLVMNMKITSARRSLAERCEVQQEQEPSARHAIVIQLNGEPRFLYNLYDLNLEGA